MSPRGLLVRFDGDDDNDCDDNDIVLGFILVDEDLLNPISLGPSGENRDLEA